MYNSLSNKGMYTKDRESFDAKYCSDLEETVSPDFFLPVQVSPEPVQEPAQISTESVQEPIKSPLISSESKDDDFSRPYKN